MSALAKLPPGSRTGPDGQRFPWGPIQAIHEIGDFAIVEYLRDESRLMRRADEPSEHGKVQFHAYIKGQNTCRGFDSLDAALAGAIAYKYEGPNSRAGEYFCRMVGIISPESHDV